MIQHRTNQEIPGNPARTPLKPFRPSFDATLIDAEHEDRAAPDHRSSL